MGSAGKVSGVSYPSPHGSVIPILSGSQGKHVGLSIIDRLFYPVVWSRNFVVVIEEGILSGSERVVRGCSAVTSHWTIAFLLTSWKLPFLKSCQGFGINSVNILEVLHFPFLVVVQFLLLELSLFTFVIQVP